MHRLDGPVTTALETLLDPGIADTRRLKTSISSVADVRSVGPLRHEASLEIHSRAVEHTSSTVRWAEDDEVSCPITRIHFGLVGVNMPS